tara:strand:+ start:1649 stop:2746 length:1098 start_codon:yes stop_codon:yes gene_type:complete
MTQKKIIIFMPSIEGGGVEKNLFIISNFFANKFNNVSIITASKKFKKKFNPKINLIFPKSNYWDNCGRRIKYFICLIILLKKIFIDKNISVLCFQANIYCLILCKLLGIKIIIRSNSSPYGWTKNPIKNLIFKMVFPLADGIVVNSNEFKKQLRKKFNVKSICIYNPLNYEEITKNSKKGTKKYFKKSRPIKILNLGRFVDQKDQVTLLKALKILDRYDFQAILVGRGILREKLQEFINTNQLRKKIKLINFTENPYPLIKESNLFILSSTFEGLPNVLLEALALKKFVISSDCPTGPKEILLNGRGGLLFKTSDHKDLAKKIKFFINNKKICNKKLTLARKKLKRFDYQKNLNLYLKIVKKLIN